MIVGDFMKLFKEIEKQIKQNKKVVIAIDGPSASGKSTLGELLQKKYDALLIHTDNYFLPLKRKTQKRLAESGGNVDYERIMSEVMDKLNSDYLKSDYFNCVTDNLEERNTLKNKQVVIVEGVYAMHSSLISYYTLKVFLEVDSVLQKNRILARNGEKMLERFLKEWIPLENYYFQQESLKEKADMVINLTIQNYYALK